MTQLMDHVTYLSKEIGPRPAGTEEEQRAALYITEQFQKEAGFAASMEDFSSSSNVEAGLAVMAGVVVVVTILAMIFSVLAIPAFILAAAAAVVYSLEEFDKPIISRILSRGASQNVVAKYIPANDTEDAVRPRGSSRKIILMAHYDTGNVTPPIVDRLERTKLPLAIMCVAGVIAATFFLLIRIFVASGGGMGLLVLNVLSVIAIVLCLYPIAKALLIRTSPYNEGAVNNATGTAALIEVARRISHGSVSEAELASINEEVVIHGEEAAREAGLIPEGVQLIYEAEQVKPEPIQHEEADEEERLLSAKAAIAALTGQPIENRIYAQIAPSSEKRYDEDIVLEPSEAPDEFNDELMPYDESYRPEEYEFDHTLGAYGYQPEDEYYTDSDGFENAPSWFVAAQQNARKSDTERTGEPQIKRSKYTEAITSAERSFAQREEEMREAQRLAREEAQRAREAEFRALMEAREQERKAASRTADVPQEYVNYATEAPQVEAAPVQAAPVEVVPIEPVQQRPDSTVAMMSGPVPAAEIIAEARAAEEAEAGLSAPVAEQDEDSSRIVLDEASIPVPLQEEAVQNRISALPSIDPANPHLDQAAERPTPVLPEIETGNTETPEQTMEPSRSGILRRLRTSIPSLSGLISPVQSESAPQTRRSVKQENLNTTVPPVNTVPTPEPSAYERNVVEIPRSRSGSLMNRLRSTNDDNLSDTPQQWLEVDEDFDPRSAGRERGGWESFRDDQYPLEADNGNGENAEAAYPPQQTRWQGGAYSRVQLGHVDMRSGEDTDADEPIVEEPVVDEEEAPIAEEIEQIYHFRNPQFNTEIWFVAVGSDGASHDGARAFVEEHRDELRGAMMIEIESLGAGSLSVASEEGRIRKAVVSSRIKRYTRAATAATGIAVNSVSLAGTDSISSTLQKSGYQVMHLFGAEDGRPALKGDADDVAENVDELVLDEHVSFVYELLKR